MSKDLYDTLGVQRDADKNTIKKAYRKRAQQAHPDKGGSAEEFYEVQQAYDILNNAVTRRSYDETGDTDDQEKLLWSEMIGLVSNIIENASNLGTTDIFKQARDRVDQRIMTDQLAVGALENKIIRYQTAIKRTKHKKRSIVLVRELEKIIDRLRGDIEKVKEDISHCKRLWDMLNEYEYAIDKDPTFEEILKRGGRLTLKVGPLGGFGPIA